MPIRIWIDQECGIVRGVVEGAFETAEMMEALNGILEDDAFTPGTPVLSDHRTVSTVLTREQAMAVAARLAAMAPQLAGMRWAVVTTHPASYGMMRMLSVLLEDAGVEMRIFEEMDEAEGWALGGG